MDKVEIYEWLKSQKYQTGYDEVGEYLMYYSVDMPKILEDYYEYKVKKLNEPAVSKSEGIERRNLLIDFGNRVVEIQNEHQCLLQNVEKEVDKYLKSINNC